MAPQAADPVDPVILRFVGEDRDGQAIQELQAAHVAEVLEGLVELNGDFSRAGAFGDGPPSSVLVRPPREGSFIIEVIRTVTENPEAAASVLGGGPTLSTVIWWATRSVRADVEDFEYLDNGNVKVKWQDKTVDEVPPAAWEELQKRKPRRKRQLRKIMAPLSEPRVTALKVSGEEPGSPRGEEPTEATAPPRAFTLERTDYTLARPEDEVEESFRIFEVEAQMAAIDFDSPDRWRVRTRDESRTATVEDKDFLGRLDRGLALRKSDRFDLRIREDSTTKNGRTSRRWTVLTVGLRREVADGDDAQPPASRP